MDLHGTTVAEAIVIVKEILKDDAATISQGRLFPLYFESISLRILCFIFVLFYLGSPVTGPVFCPTPAIACVFFCFGYSCLELPSGRKAKPLKIITGRGKHSVNQVGVLKPAVKKALVEDGWVVGSWDGGLVVSHRRA